ncbi:hypothetical protein IV500_06495 [Paeniglutamicibacter antarcticus]|uniref:Uncharacterized protein n=1 Tax=Arthrobacter terrae TaxID=2935737 RepID=A0A931G794_9MICC|nr:hypothetical protein [Arthrobacter terrae]MBG0739049.1 hypothetical protein [Arthrobacter terrae]
MNTEQIENALAIAAAARELPMPWLTQAGFPGKKIVKDSFRDALAKFPETDAYDAITVRHALQTIIQGPDPRGGSFKAQAIHAAAQLHELALKELTTVTINSSNRGV